MNRKYLDHILVNLGKNLEFLELIYVALTTALLHVIVYKQYCTIKIPAYCINPHVVCVLTS